MGVQGYPILEVQEYPILGARGHAGRRGATPPGDKNKKLIPNQQNNSDFYKNKHLLCDGEVTIFTTSNSGGNWQMRMRVEGHRQYHQKSLRTKNFETAKERAKIEHAVAFVKMTEGKSLFSPTL